MDRRLQLTAALAKRLPDPRDPTKVIHPLVTLLRQRIDGLCQGDEDRHDHERLRTDVALPTAVEQDDELASAATLCRWRTVPTGAPRGWCSSGGANSSSPVTRRHRRSWCWTWMRVRSAAKDDPVHGKQEGAFLPQRLRAASSEAVCRVTAIVSCHCTRSAGERLWVA